MNVHKETKITRNEHVYNNSVPILIFVALGVLAFFAFILFGIGGSAFVYKDV